MELLEQKLDSFDPQERKAALSELIEKSQRGEVQLPPVGTCVNLHIHTFYGYNAYGYSPSKAAWLARKYGLVVAGIIDFDVLDGLDEFLDAARLMQIKACVGIETRVYIPEFAEKEINSPREPGIAYHIGMGFPKFPHESRIQKFLTGLKQVSQQRNIDLMNRVNRFLDPVAIDFNTDVLPLTPNGNSTERHLCLAYAIKAEKMFIHSDELSRFWRHKLGCPADSLDLPSGPKILGEIRKRTIKKGGVGYVQPDKGSFPTMAEVNRFILEAGGIPTFCWLDGISEGEKEEEKLLEVAMKSGVRAFSVIPNPAYTPNDPKKKLENLYKVVKLVDTMGLPIVSGTEMNNFGQKFVDDFESKELATFVPVFLKGGHIIYAHSVIQREANLGYTSKWAERTFGSVTDKNRFFEKLGQMLNPENESRLSNLQSNPKPREILAALGS